MDVRKRTYRIIIGKPVKLGKGVVNITNQVKEDADSAYVIDNTTLGPHIEFKINKDNSKEPNKGSVTIYNLSDDTVNYLDQNQSESLAILFEAGYNWENSLTFAGTVEFVQDVWEGETRKTKLILGDGSLNIISSNTARSYRKGTPLDKILLDLVADLKLPVGRIVKFGNKVSQYSMAFTGNAANNLERFARNTGSTFSVQDGAVYWTRQGSRFEEVLVEISPETGMHDSPTLQNPEPNKRRKSKSKAKPSKKEDAGLVVKTALNGAIIPETTIYLKSRKFTGFYKVVYVKHTGSLEEGEWVSEVGLSEAKNGVLKEKGKEIKIQSTPISR